VKIRIPEIGYKFGQRVTVVWYEAEIENTEATITGINYDHRRSPFATYTITEDDGYQTDEIDEEQLIAND